MNNSQYTIEGLIKVFKKELAGLYPDREIQSFIYLVFEESLNLSKVDLYSKSETILSEVDSNKILNIISQLKEFKPLQYIYEKTWFYTLPINVNPDVLIPRPETEELADWIVKETGNKLVKIIDIGTGSGCIAIALNKNIFRSKVDAMDISENALYVASENALTNNAFINFIKADILNWRKHKFENNYDIIVSNPPYVRESEKQQMQANVLNYEPHLALFVSDEDPLIYYKAILDFAKVNLKENGKIFFEINENLSDEITDLFIENGFKNTELKKDINGKYRMVMGYR